MDLHNLISSREAKEKEMEFFKSNEYYKMLPPTVLGVESLIAKLTSVLVDRIISQMPMMLKESEAQLSESMIALKELGDAPPEGNQVFMMLNKMAMDFVQIVKNSLNGHYISKELIDCENLRTCAVIHKLKTNFKDDVNQTKLDFGTDRHIQYLIRMISESRGQELPGFLCFGVFKMLMSRELLRWDKVAKEFVDKVVACTHEIIQKFIKLKSSSFMKFRSVLSKIMDILIEERKIQLLKKLEDNLREEMEVPSTQNHYFMDNVCKIRLQRKNTKLKAVLKLFEAEEPVYSIDSRKLYEIRNDQYKLVQDVYTTGYNTKTKLNISADQLFQQLQTTLSTEGCSNERQEAEEMDIFFQSYWKVANKRFIDKIPQLVDVHFLEEICKSLTNELLPKLMDHRDDLFSHAPAEVEKRSMLVNKIDRLNQATALLKAHSWRISTVNESILKSSDEKSTGFLTAAEPPAVIQPSTNVKSSDSRTAAEPPAVIQPSANVKSPDSRTAAEPPAVIQPSTNVEESLKSSLTRRQNERLKRTLETTGADVIVTSCNYNSEDY